MSWQGSLTVALVSGVSVPIILALLIRLWNYTRIPTVLSRRVRRTSYLGFVLDQSERGHINTLDVLAPRLEPAGDRRQLHSIQQAWKQVNGRGTVRVLTLDTQSCLEGGAELLRHGINVRVVRPGLGSESLSFHIFNGEQADQASAIINHHRAEGDQPVRLHGAAPTQVFHSHFQALWQRARPLSAVLAERITAGADDRSRLAVLRSLRQARATLSLDGHCVERVLPHLAFRHSCQVIFVVGNPGAGKSYVRRMLMNQFQEIGIDSASLTDYVYAYRDHLHGLLKLSGARYSGFKAYDGGAFMVRDESVLAPALRALAGAVRDSVSGNEVTLVEFARTNLVDALREFEGADFQAQVIHVSAPDDLRAARLRRRAVPPVSHVGPLSISLELSDNHLLPSTVERTIYNLDGLDELRAAAPWRERLFEIKNDVDDDGYRVETQLQDFFYRIVAPYRVT
jgi:dephospho-CoA kinase